ncbi:hypothetical protein [Catenulispora yoronensis]|uniref:hypothetical protein n=1 Tax=Catenulispora yoronensis TaxID=450799 RepID=UPI0031D9596B
MAELDGRRTFTVVDIIEIHVHWYAGRSKRGRRVSATLPEETGRSRVTVLRDVVDSSWTTSRCAR